MKVIAALLFFALAALNAMVVEPVGSVTASFGVAEFQAGEALNDFMRRADRALYQAKRDGRNRVAVSSAGADDEDHHRPVAATTAAEKSV